MPTKLIVGCGYLGRRVAALWRQQGERVIGLTRQPGGPAFFQDLGIEPLVGDILRPDSLLDLLAADTVLYAVGWDRSSGATMRQVYVEGLANVLERLSVPTRFIYVSSTSVYGQADESWVDEDSPTEPAEEAGRIVLEAEKLVRERLPQAIILRFAGIYGAGRLLRQKALAAGEPIVGDGGKWLNLIHVDDGARAVLAAEVLAAEEVGGRTFIVSDGQPVRRQDFFAELARLLQAPAPRFVPPPVDTPAPPHERGNRRLNNRRLREELHFKFAYPDFRAGLLHSI